MFAVGQLDNGPKSVKNNTKESEACKKILCSVQPISFNEKKISVSISI